MAPTWACHRDMRRVTRVARLPEIHTVMTSTGMQALLMATCTIGAGGHLSRGMGLTVMAAIIM
jgi:hypothetical protein